MVLRDASASKKQRICWLHCIALIAHQSPAKCILRLYPLNRWSRSVPEWRQRVSRSPEQRLQPAQNFWVFSFYIADFWQTFWVIWENGSNWSNLRLKMSFFALGRLKNHKVPHLHPIYTMFMPLDRLQLKIYAFSGKFNVCSKRVLLSWIKICRDFTLQTQIFTQKYRSWLRFYSEFLRKKLAVGASELKFCQYFFLLMLGWGYEV